MIFDLKKELKKMQKMLKDRPDEALIKGYKRAMKAYENTGEVKHKHAGSLIKKEIDRRGLKIED